MLLRGQNLLAYRNFDDSIVSRFVEKAALNGIDVFRVYDAFNDIRNLKASLEGSGRLESMRRDQSAMPPVRCTRSRACGHGPADKGIGLRLNLHSGRGWFSNRKPPTIWLRASKRNAAKTRW